jgi:hypothetical protein
MPSSLSYPGSEPLSNNSEAWEILSACSSQGQCCASSARCSDYSSIKAPESSIARILQDDSGNTACADAAGAASQLAVEPADGGAGDEASSDKTSSGDSYTGSGPAGSLISQLLQQLAECRPEDVIRQQELLVQLAAAVQQQEPSSIQSTALTSAAVAHYEAAGKAAKRVLVLRCSGEVGL